MILEKYLGKKVKIEFDDETILAKVVGYTSAADNEPDDDGNYGGEYISVVPLKDTKHLSAGTEFSAHDYEIKLIEVIE